MTDIEKLKHFKSNPKGFDYLQTYDSSLNKFTYKEIKEIDLDGLSLEVHLSNLEKDVAGLKEQAVKNTNKINELTKLLNEIVKGLNIR